MRLRSWFAEKGTPIYTGVRYQGIDDHGLRLFESDGRERTIEADDIVVALPQVPNPGLAQTLGDIVPEVHAIGPTDGDRPWLIVDAVAAGFEVGSTV
jgi:hypothetical protein